MIYRVLKWITGIALYWFYRDIRIVGLERIPMNGPLLIAANHQNALVDSLIIGWLAPRPIVMTAKATLTDNLIVALIFRLLHVVRLRRSRDEIARTDGAEPDRKRNTRAFEEILDLLRRRRAVLIFPEGKSHNEHGLEPLKTGLARVALQGRDGAGLRGVKILPIGLVFEDKGSPGTLVRVHVGNAIEMDSWAGNDYLTLTREIASRLRDVSELAPVPEVPTNERQRRSATVFHESFMSLAARWGRVTHEFPIRIARHIALRRSTDADQPAMLTILFGIAFVALTYVVQVAVVGILLRSTFFATLYLGSLVYGAYCAALQRYSRNE
jgi:glycerol-3-phosphate O-acyltransferase/dihydroxyacetone phosphate acyltransferase